MNNKFAVPGNECIEMKLIREPGEVREENNFFRPLMCHQFFGKTEIIKGYSALRVKLYYSAGWCNICCVLEYSSSAENVAGEFVHDIVKIISGVYKVQMIENFDEFEKKLTQDNTFKPYGTLISSFSIKSTDEGARIFEIYHCTCDDSGFKSYYNRLQTLILWFIDGANLVEPDDPNWNYFIVYERYIRKYDNELAYGIVGFTTVYNYFAYPAKIRPRISQVLILPPFQSQGICARLLEAIYDFYSADKKLLDFTVEDPTEEFQRVRDFVDCSRVLNSKFYTPETLVKGIPSDFLNKLQTILHLNKKQAIRVSEILRLQNLDTSDIEKVKEYRLDIKRKLNQPFQKQLSIKQKCAATMTPEALRENFVSDENRKEKLNFMYNELIDQYNFVVHRLNSQ